MEKELLDQVETGKDAEDLYNHPLVQGFLNETENAILYGIKKSDRDDLEGREAFYRMLKTLDSFKAMFVHYMDRGETAKRMLENLREGRFDNI